MKEKVKKGFIYILWLFLLGAFLGYIIETIFYLLKYHEFVNKSGLWYGHLKPIYGLGAVLLTIILYKVKDQSLLKTFIYGIIIGTAFEYIASLFQEYVLGVYTWNYANFNLNLNGRIYLPYCFIWGLITIIYFKGIFPYYEKLFKKLYSYRLVLISLVVTIFLAYDCLLTGVIAYRYSARRQGVIATNKISNYIDQKYPDELIQKRMPKLRLVANLK